MKTGTLQDLTALTPEQEKAFKRVQRAHKDFIKAGGRYYVVLDRVAAYNGRNFDNVDGDEGNANDPLLCANDLSLPDFSHTSLSGFADDTHYFVPAAGVEVIAGSDADDGYSGWDMDEESGGVVKDDK